MKTLLITGNMGSGKSSFINKVIMSQGVSLTGIRSIRHFENHRFKGFDLSIIVDYKPIKTWQIARIDDEGMLITPNFEPATKFLKSVLKNYENNNLIFIDEIGRFERNNKDYLSAVNSLVNSDIKTIISLKKEDLPFNKYLINLSKKDKEIEFVDLDYTDFKDLDIILKGFSFNAFTNKKKVIFYDNEDRVNIENEIGYEGRNYRAGLDDIEFERIDDLLNLTYDDFSLKLNNRDFIYCFTNNIDKMKRIADLGLIPIKSLEELK